MRERQVPARLLALGACLGVVVFSTFFVLGLRSDTALNAPKATLVRWPAGKPASAAAPAPSAATSSAKGPRPWVSGLQHVAISVKDVPRSLEFYVGVLGFSEMPRTKDFSFPGAWIDVGHDQHVHLVMAEDSGRGAIHGNHMSFHVRDIQQLRERLLDKGVEVSVASTFTVGQQVWQQIYVRDPDDHMIELLEVVDMETWNRLQLSDSNWEPHPRTATATTTTTAAAAPDPAHAAKPNPHDPRTRPPQGLEMLGMGTAGVAVGNPLIRDVAEEILRRGGSAVDAAIAMNAAYGVVEPMNAGLGGDLFAMVYNPQTGKLEGINGSGKAGSAMSLDGLARRVRVAQGGSGEGADPNAQTPTPTLPTRGALSALTTPGAVRAWCEMHQRHGKLEWRELFAPAVDLALNGFKLTAHTAKNWANLRQVVEARERGELTEKGVRDFLRVFSLVGRPPVAGELYANQALGHTLQELADTGCEGFYDPNGRVAQLVEAVMKQEGGAVRAQDFAAQDVLWVQPLNMTYRNKWTVHAMPSNSQGATGLQMLQAMNLFSPDVWRRDEVQRLHNIISLKRAVFDTDQALMFGDAAGAGLNATYLLSDVRARQLRDIAHQAFEQGVAVPPTVPTAVGNRRATSGAAGYGVAAVDDDDYDHDHDHDSPPEADGGTVGFAVTDGCGLAVTVLQSNSLPWGSGLVHSGLGFVLQGSGSRFALKPGHPNAFAPGKRPFHTLSPVFVQKDSKPYLLAAVTGGEQQAYAFAQVLSTHVDLGFGLQEAVDAPRFRDSDCFGPTPWQPDGGDPAHRATATCVEMDARLPEQATLGWLGVLGYPVTAPSPHVFEDSGFGVLQGVEYRSTRSWLGLSDTTRKPGAAMEVDAPCYAHERQGNVEWQQRQRQRHRGETRPPWMERIWGLMQGTGEEQEHGDGEEQEGMNVVFVLPDELKAGWPELALSQSFGVSITSVALSEGRERVDQVLAQTNEVAAVVPVVRLMEQLEDVEAALEGVPRDMLVAFPGADMTRTFYDRFKFRDWMTDHGFGAYLPERFAGAESVLLPCVVRSEESSFGRGVQIANTEEELWAAVELASTDVFFEEALMSPIEHTINFAAVDGDVVLVTCVTFEFNSTLFVKGRGDIEGNKKKGEDNACAFEPPAAIGLVQAIVQAANYSGFGCLQYKVVIKDQRNVIKVIEVNPRICGSLAKSGKGLSEHVRAWVLAARAKQ